MSSAYGNKQKHESNNPAQRALIAHFHRRLAEIVRAFGPSEILDVGCGEGYTLAALRAEGIACPMSGIDLSETAIAEASLRVPAASFSVEDALELARQGRKYDLVMMTEVLEHIPSPGRALAEMRRVVADGGVAVVSVPNERLINTLKAMLRRSGLYRLLLVGRSGDYEMPERMDDEWHLHVFDLAGLLAMIPRGLRVTRVEGIPFRWLPLRYVVRCESDGRDDEHRASG